ncbi:hypothetical protein D3C76_1030150 [compost metagenome]
MHLQDGHGLFLEGAAGGHIADAAFPLGVGEVHHCGRQVFLVDLLRVEHDDARTGGDAHPGAVGANVLLGHHVRGGVVDLRQQAQLAQVVQGRGFFGVDDVGGRAVAFLDDLAGQLVAAALADIDVDSGLGLVGLGDGFADFLVLTVVHGQGDRCVCHGGRSADDQAQRGGGQGTHQRLRADRHAGTSSLTATYLETMVNEIVSQVAG